MRKLPVGVSCPRLPVETGAVATNMPLANTQAFCCGMLTRMRIAEPGEGGAGRTAFATGAAVGAAEGMLRQEAGETRQAASSNTIGSSGSRGGGDTLATSSSPAPAESHQSLLFRPRIPHAMDLPNIMQRRC